jgi:hypothetical protein
MSATYHIMTRIAQRVDDNATQRAILASCERWAARVDASMTHAIIIGRVPVARGRMTFEDDGRGISNGTVAVLIVKDGRMVTLFWRREAQPFTREALRVDNVVGA